MMVIVLQGIRTSGISGDIFTIYDLLNISYCKGKGTNRDRKGKRRENKERKGLWTDTMSKQNNMQQIENNVYID